MHIGSRPRLVLLAFALLGISALGARRPLTHQDYDSWRSIHSQTVSRDGHYLACALFPQEGDGELVVRNLTSGQQWREPIGQQPPPARPDPLAEDAVPRPRSITISFSSSLRYLVFSTFPTKAQTDQAKKEHRKAEEMPAGGLDFMDLASGAVVRVASVKTFQVSEKADFAAYLKEPATPQKKPASEDDAADPKKPAKKEYGSDLILRNLADQTERTLPDVIEYSLSKDGRALVFAVSATNDEANGSFVVSPGNPAPPTALAAGTGKYSKFAWDEKQTELAFIGNRDGNFKLYLWDRKGPAAAEAVSVDSPGFRKGFEINDKSALRFAKTAAGCFSGPDLP